MAKPGVVSTYCKDTHEIDMKIIAHKRSGRRGERNIAYYERLDNLYHVKRQIDNYFSIEY